MGESEVTVITRHTLIRGELHLTGPTVIAGRVEGQVVSQDALEVSAEGDVEGDIQGVVVDIQGTVRGKVVASQTCRLGAQARVSGELRVANLVTAEGASYAGQVYLGSAAVEEPAAPTGEAQTVSHTINRLETLTIESMDMAQAAAVMASVEQAPAGMATAGGVRIVPQTVQQTVNRSPKIIKAR